MKKNLLIFAAIFALAVPVFSSCNKSGDDNKKDSKDVVMKDGTTKSAAKVVKFDKTLPPKYKDPNGSYDLKKMEFTEDGMCMIERQLVTRADIGDIISEVFGYTVSGNTYTIIGFGTVVISGNSVTVTFDSGGEGGTFEATITPTSTSTVDENNMARTWKVSSVMLNVSGNGVSIKKTFNGCNLEEIGKYAADNGVSGLSKHLNDLKGYIVDYVIFTGADTFIITFKGANAIAGTFKLQANNKLNYNLPEGNPFFHGSSTGDFEFPADKKTTIKLNITVEGYTGYVEMSLTAAN